MGPNILSLVESESLFLKSNNTLEYWHGVETSVLCREVVPISEVKKSIGMGLKQVSFVERSSLSRRVPYQRFHSTISTIGV